MDKNIGSSNLFLPVVLLIPLDFVKSKLKREREKERKREREKERKREREKERKRDREKER
jgi:hypothetical protein